MLGGIGRVSMSLDGFGFIGETSDWSNTQTITIPANTPLSSTSANSSLYLITTIALVVIAILLVVIIFLLLYVRKRKSQDVKFE